jgi:hypothetical protein
MKKIIFMLLAVAALTSCSKFEPVSKGGDESGSSVKLSGSIYTGAATRLDGVIGGTLPLAPLTFSVYRADQTGPIGSLSWPATFAPTTVIGTLGTTAVAGNISTAPQLYYLPEANRRSAFIGLHPENATGSAGVVTYPVLNGGKDIMCTVPVNGDKSTSGDLNLTFHHLLTKITVELVTNGADNAAKGNISDLWGKISEIKVEDKAVAVDVTLPGPTGTGHGSAAAAALPTPDDLALVNEDGTAISTPKTISKTATASTFGHAMFVPVTSSAKLKFFITTEKGGLQTVETRTLQTYDEGYGYIITVTFTATGVSITNVSTAGSINPWQSGGTDATDDI